MCRYISAFVKRKRFANSADSNSADSLCQRQREASERDTRGTEDIRKVICILCELDTGSTQGNAKVEVARQLALCREHGC